MAYKNPEDQKKAAREHYSKNKNLYIERAKIGKIKSLKRNREFVLNYLRKHPCVDGEEANPVVLEFDHRKSEEKLGNVADLAINGVSLSNLVSEMEKCDVRCANCHRIKTAKEEGW